LYDDATTISRMKIDIHTHTKKIKQGDSEHRNIDANRFAEIIKETDVKILAITNHNHFDFIQYTEFKDNVDGICQIWPGIEFDILEDERRLHLIVIVNPKNAKAFSIKVNEIIGTTSPDTFSISIDDVVSEFNEFDTIFIAHYHSKKPFFIDQDIEKLLNKVSNSKRVLKEASNSISAGIYISHGHNSIHGSDVQNWNDYLSNSKYLPELRLPVESYEQFCLLLEKDDRTINTILDKKNKETIQINPFNSAAEIMDIDIYDDINILFGSKGTGKTDILKALSKHYNGKGFKTEVYESSSKKIDDVFDLKGSQLKVEIEELGIDNCSTELTSLRNATEKEVTSLSKYLLYYSADATNKISKNIKVDKLTPLDEKSSKRSFDDIKKNLEVFQEFKNYYAQDAKLREIIGEDLLDELDNVVNRILDKINEEIGLRFTDYKSISFFNKLIKLFVKEISKKTGQPEKPTKTGFSEYASNRIAIENDVKKILENISKTIHPIIEEVGNLGEKGKLYCQTNFLIQNGKISDVNYKHITSNTKNPQKSVASKIELISKHIYTNTLFEKIDELKKVESSETVTSIFDLLLFYKHFTLDSDFYVPSSGESLMVLLHNELMKEKEIYLIDEPERSLGNDYISEVIVPLIKEKAKSGKRVIIATHDANIAVRTLPYNSIYREHDIKGYYTYSGNPFSNSLICSLGKKPNLDWKIISMKTLEGGKAAFGERGKIYGNT
jgi:ABC-type lipoprotein export system ATPase subunit